MHMPQTFNYFHFHLFIYLFIYYPFNYVFLVLNIFSLLLFTYKVKAGKDKMYEERKEKKRNAATQ